MEQSPSAINSARKRLVKDRIFHSLKYYSILSRSRAITQEDKLPKAEEIIKVKEKLLHKIHLITNYTCPGGGVILTVVSI